MGFKAKRSRVLTCCTTIEIDDTLNKIVKELKAQGFSVSKSDLINEALLTYFSVMQMKNEKAKKEKEARNAKVN